MNRKQMEEAEQISASHIGKENSMGIYVNPGNTVYRRALKNQIYIDKTELIRHTNSRIGSYDQYMCVSRPRRFGKSMAADMLVAYYSRGCDSKELFAGKKIESDPSFQEHLNKYNVIRIDVQQYIKRYEDVSGFLGEIQKSVLEELQEEFGTHCRLHAKMGLSEALNRIFSKTGRGFVFIIDEWDCVFRMLQDREDLQKQYLDFLRSLFKGSVYTELVYMTGILPIKKYGDQSAINMFDEFSMTDLKDLSCYFGFTEEEVMAECTARGVDFEEMRDWYDGYRINGSHIYNPKSVTDALKWKRFKNYWTGTETYESLKAYIDRNFDGLKEAIIEMIGGGRCVIDPLTFRNDLTSLESRDDVLTLLVHLGYLTYDGESEEVSIPNLEIRQEFERAIKSGSNWAGLMQSLDRSAQLLEDTWNLDEKAVAAGIDAIHGATTSILNYNNENALSCVIYMAYAGALAYYLPPVREMPAGKGYADIVYLPRQNTDRPALVVELKWNKTAEGAIRQIKDKQYSDWIRSYTGKILLIGINYDRKSKTHTCRIEQDNK